MKALTVPTKSHSHEIGTQEKRFGSINLDFLHLYSRNNFIRSGYFYIFHKDPLMSPEEKKICHSMLSSTKTYLLLLIATSAADFFVSVQIFFLC